MCSKTLREGQTWVRLAAGWSSLLWTCISAVPCWNCHGGCQPPWLTVFVDILPPPRKSLQTHHLWSQSCGYWPPLWSSGQSFWLQIQRSRVRSPALPDFLSSSGSGTGSTQPREPREINWGATWMKKVGAPGLEKRLVSFQVLNLHKVVQAQKHLLNPYTEWDLNPRSRC